MIDKRVKRARELIDRIRELVQPLLDREKQLSGAHGQQASDLLSATGNAAAMIDEDEKRREELLKNAYVHGTACVRVSGKTHQGVTIRIGDRETVFHRELKGPVTFERRKIKNVSEIVADEEAIRASSLELDLARLQESLDQAGVRREAADKGVFITLEGDDPTWVRGSRMEL
ncbi:MAG: hypothetical protein IIA33_11180, partial [Planctomycetes bacterium]|nr:hypothetical protein [Planctomycetota bacterium]